MYFSLLFFLGQSAGLKIKLAEPPYKVHPLEEIQAWGMSNKPVKAQFRYQA